jgi:hypothetical protein
MAALAMICVTSCSRVYQFAGIVIDGDGQPIAGATFAINPHDWDEPDSFDSHDRSAEDGTFETGWGSAVGVEFFRFKTRCDGFVEDERIVEADAKNLRIVLAREPSGR